MRASVFRGLIAVSLLVGCSDRAERDGDAWKLAQDAGADADATAPTDTRVVVDAARDMPRDMAPRDMRPPRDTPPDIDMSVPTAPFTGWFTSSFEHSGFVESAPPHLDPLGENCDPLLFLEPPVENWWVTGGGPYPFGNPTINGFGAASLVTIDGELTGLGEYGHLGQYDRELTPVSWERHACETAAEPGHCVRPLRSDVCVIPAINEPDATMRSTLVVTYPGIAVSPVSYELRVTFGENIGDGRTDAVVRWQTDDQSLDVNGYLEVSVLQNVELIQERHGLFYSEIHYEQLEGWVTYSDGDADGWYVSISGVEGEDPDAGTGMHVWGWFDVTDTIALP